jgi:hypothetical protein
VRTLSGARRGALAAAGLALLAAPGCSTLENTARDAVLAGAVRPQEVEFEEVTRYPGDVVCGSYTTLDLRGVRRGSRRFIYSSGQLYSSPGAEQLALLCTDSPAEALHDRLGIGPWSGEAGELGTLRRDLHAIEDALGAYAAAEGDLPRSGDLAALAPPRGDYLDAVPLDPWGQPYRYERGLGPRASGQYRLFSLGSDAAVGGSGPAADVGREHLPYLDRLAALAP